MTSVPSDTPGISLDALLRAKEKRAARQTEWLSDYHRPVISLTLVTPGQVKDSARYQNTMGEAIRACDHMLWQHHWPVLDRKVRWLPTGAEALWCVDHPAVEIKARCIEQEQTHPLGRLWDFDVICPDHGPIGRQSLNLSTRRCLVCDQPAHGCVRSQRHPIDQVVSRVEALIDGWFARD